MSPTPCFGTKKSPFLALFPISPSNFLQGNHNQYIFPTENCQYLIDTYIIFKFLQGWWMASLKQILAFNMREQRRVLGISQATLAEWINTSTNYIAMIELGRKTPSLPMLERIAAALKIEASDLFSVKRVPSVSLRNLHKAVL